MKYRYCKWVLVLAFLAPSFTLAQDVSVVEQSQSPQSVEQMLIEKIAANQKTVNSQRAELGLPPIDISTNNSSHAIVTISEQWKRYQALTNELAIVEERVRILESLTMEQRDAFAGLYATFIGPRSGTESMTGQMMTEIEVARRDAVRAEVEDRVKGFGSRDPSTLDNELIKALNKCELDLLISIGTLELERKRMQEQ